jgi:hypothetical protein
MLWILRFANKGRVRAWAKVCGGDDEKRGTRLLWENLVLHEQGLTISYSLLPRLCISSVSKWTPHTRVGYGLASARTQKSPSIQLTCALPNI